ncbi:23S rRNA (adenine(2030)-N(6))-methyltransferase RlmJ [Frateuria aurantia]|uniref:Ribosomal RNA large subunit methyltransferase J n=1 Tax=Frateuria aurantia (strain ATCC 33424 / DSM 6220 / KCTC 2777 / LMG 1558 / NBRC 3245 / NCIMB 13370) TaxID=767434 RepID=H8L1K9_FRAAD|nr:23S rRNA (adenine(2030)-N(6))-methyltransferase RlmJ [Frateuria aurantia]AFC85369.1 protein involved in catabolism of external DNA [Frateuria aurantia DSM 6220]
MNYQHAYHAGNFADVHKHVMLRALLQALQQKPTPIGLLDTHAGAGGYALDGREATATGEFAEGIARLIKTTDAAAPELIREWLVDILQWPANQSALRFYPGSPLQAAACLREGDTLQLCEVQDAAVASLRRQLGGNRQVHIHQRDGYAAMKALLPPPQKRGLVLIDPPYEAQEEEYRTLQARLDEALARWPGGVYAVWYPIKQSQRLQPFYRWLAGCAAKRVLRSELLVHPADSPLRLNGSGLVVLNAPWQLDQSVRSAMHWLGLQLGAPGERAAVTLDWLRQD